MPKRFPPGISDEIPASAAERTFLDHLLDVVEHPRVALVRVVVGAHENEIRARIPLPPESLVINLEWQKGQLSSLQCAIRSLPAKQTEGSVVCLVDHPLISRRLVGALIDSFEKAPDKIVIPIFRGRRGHPVIFPSKFYGELLDAPLDVGARAVVRAHSGEIVEVAISEEGVALNLNDPESLRKIEQRLK